MQFASSCVIPTTWVALPLLSRRAANHDTLLLDFGLPPDAAGADVPLSLPVCGCLLLKAPGREHASKGGGDAVRPYTPVSPPALRGRFTLLVKVYKEWGDQAYPHSYRPAGAVSNYLAQLVAGKDAAHFCHVAKNVKLRLPFPPAPPAPPPAAAAPSTAAAAAAAAAAAGAGVRTVTMVAVGAGVAPMAQALPVLLGDGTTRVVLLLGNRSVGDILLRPQLEAWQAAHPQRFKLVYVVGSRWSTGVRVGLARPEPPAGFETLAHPRLIALAQRLQEAQEACASDAERAAAEAAHLSAHGEEMAGLRPQAEIGWVTELVLRKHAFPPAADTRVFVCGLPRVYESLCGPREEAGALREGSALHKLGYSAEMVVKF